MLKKSLILAITFCTIIATAQQNDYTFTNIEEAKIYAYNNSKNILLVFAGSDWCRPCIQFKKEVLQTETFQNFAGKQLTVLYLDFPAKKKNKLPLTQTEHNEKLAKKYNSNGSFPKIVLINPNEEILGEIPFKNQSPDDFISICDKIMSI